MNRIISGILSLLYVAALLAGVNFYAFGNPWGEQHGRAKPASEANRQEPHFRKIAGLPRFPYADGWLGGDGGLSVQLSDTTVLWIFSDTFVSGKPEASSRKALDGMVANSVAVSTHSGDQFSIQYYWRKREGAHFPFFESPHKGERYWPVHTFTARDTLYVFMQQVETVDTRGKEELFNFRITGITLAVVTNIQNGDPCQWKVSLIPYLEFYPMESWTQATTDREWLYVLKNSQRSNFLTRIPLDRLTAPSGFVEYLTADDTWTKGSTGEDRKILFSEQANGSLDYYPDLKKWIYIYGPVFPGNEIKYRHSDRITGPWPTAQVIYRTPEQTTGSSLFDKRHFCYLARSHPAYYDANRKVLRITYDCNSTQFAHVASSDSIYIPRVIEVEASFMLEGDLQNAGH